VVNANPPSISPDADRRQRRVLFIVPPYYVAPSGNTIRKSVRSFVAFPYGALTLASYIRKACRHSPQVRLLDLNLSSIDQVPETLEQTLREFAPDIVALSMAFDISYSHIGPIAHTIKEIDSRTLVVMGGPAVTVSLEEIISEQPDIDALCNGEGELAMRDLVDADDGLAALNSTPWVTHNHVGLPSWRTVEDLDEVIDVDYDLVDTQRYSMKEAFSPFASEGQNGSPSRQFFIVTSRGCPFKCVFCAEPSFHGKSMRFASVDGVIDHVRRIVDQYNMNVLTIYDDQLLIDRKRAKELFHRLAEFNLRIEMPNGVTLAYIDEELASLMRQAGVRTIFLAIESGSDHVLHNIIRKPLKSSLVGPIVTILRDNGIFVQAFFINGFPGERDIDRSMTLEKIKEWGIDWALFNFATPLRGSELYRKAKENGWLDEKYQKIGATDMTSVILNVPGLDPKQIEEETYYMNLDVNFVNNFRMRSGDYDTASRSFEEVLARHPRHPFAHYFLAKCRQTMGQDEDAERHMKTFLELIAEDGEWMKAARHFSLA
jgi:radical SAM superfamily enzyme YgiQ (UPF0313 family)